jgi:hypothetical protein
MMKLFICLLLFASIVCVPGVVAQDLPQIFTLQDPLGVLTIAYPGGWLAEQREANFSYGVISNQPLVTTEKPIAQVEISIIAIGALAIEVDRSADNLAVAYFNGYQQSTLVEPQVAYGRVIPVQFGMDDTTFDGALMMLLEPSNILPIAARTKVSLGVAIEIDSNSLLFLEFLAAEGIAGQMRPVWQGMLESVTWNGIPLSNAAVREQVNVLESAALLRQKYVDLYEAQEPTPQSISGIDRRSEFILTASTMPVTFPRPRGWYPVELIPDVVRFESRRWPGAALTFRWLPAATLPAALSPAALPGLTLLHNVSMEPEYRMVDLLSFTWSGYPAAGITYQFPRRNLVGLRFAVSLPAGLVEISAESTPSQWTEMKLVLLAASSGLKFGETAIDFSELVRASNALTNP